MVLELLTEVGIQNPGQIMKSYPHQLSGGMRQRVMIAMASICRPRILVADEPTTALDVTTQAHVLSLLKRVNEEFGTTILFISGLRQSPDHVRGQDRGTGKNKGYPESSGPPVYQGADPVHSHKRPEGKGPDLHSRQSPFHHGSQGTLSLCAPLRPHHGGLQADLPGMPGAVQRPHCLLSYV